VVGLGHDHRGVGVLAEIGGCAVPELVEFEAGVILRLVFCAVIPLSNCMMW
jgi:hypothetical protein